MEPRTRVKRYFILIGLMATLLLGLGCSSGSDDGRANREEGDGERGSVIKKVKPRDTAAEAKEPDGGLGEAVEVGDVSIRVIDVRSGTASTPSPVRERSRLPRGAASENSWRWITLPGTSRALR
jgi:hypothetical protein